MTFEDAMNLVVKDTDLGLTYKEATFAYGMSKMTVKNELEKGLNPYKKLLFVEFLEFVGRCAAVKYRRFSDPLY